MNTVYNISVTSVLGLCSPRSPCATTARNCTYPPRYYYADPPLYRISPSSLTPTQWLCVVMTSYVQNNTFPTSLEDYQKKLIQFTVFYLRSGLVLALYVTSCRFALPIYVPAAAR